MNKETHAVGTSTVSRPPGEEKEHNNLGLLIKKINSYSNSTYTVVVVVTVN